MIKPLKISVRFRDCDMMGHVNNAVYLSYFEQARMHYFKEMVGKDWDYKKHGMILVHNEITYLKPIFLNDSPEIYLYLVKVGTKSFTFGYEIRVDNEVVTTGKSKLVCYDFKENKSVPVHPELINAFDKLSKEP